MIVWIVVVAVAICSFSAGWVFRDARARGLPLRKALTWAALQGVDWPIFLWLYRRARPRRLRTPAGPDPDPNVGGLGTLQRP